MDGAVHSPSRRLRDKADVVELILRRKLPRDLPVAPAVRLLYRETWDALQAESWEGDNAGELAAAGASRQTEGGRPTRAVKTLRKWLGLV